MVKANEVIIDPRGKMTRVQRPPVPWSCACNYSDIIVLPKAKGVLVFKCPVCGRTYKMVFGPDGGDMYQIT
jgi:hypothetical protein